MKTGPKKKDKPKDFFPSDDDFLRIFLPMLDDEEQRRLAELEENEDEEVNHLYDQDED